MLIVFGLLIVALAVVFDGSYRARQRTIGWDVPVRGTVERVQSSAHGIRGWVQVWFVYTLDDGRRGRGVLRPGGYRTGATDALEMASSYREGAHLTAFANPDNPVEAVVMVAQSTDPWRRYTFGAFGLLWIAVGLLVRAVGSRRRAGPA